MVRSSSAIGARLRNAILVIFLVGRRCHLLSRVGDIIFVSGIPTYGRTVTNKGPVVTYYVLRTVEVINILAMELMYTSIQAG